MIPEAKHTVTQFFDEARASFVICSCSRVLAAIKLDDQFLSETCEVDEV